VRFAELVTSGELDHIFAEDRELHLSTTPQVATVAPQ